MSKKEITVDGKTYNILEIAEPPMKFDKKQNKWVIVDHSPERLKQWTYQYYLESKEKVLNHDILPIVVPSYKRGAKASTLQLLKNYPELKVVLFIYKDEYELYKPLLDEYPHIHYELCEGFRGIAPKRAYINRRMVELGMPEFFVLDDDATSFSFTVHGNQVKKPEDYKAQKIDINIQDFFRLFQYVIKNKSTRKIDLCGIIFDNGVWCQDLRTLEDIIFIAGQAFLIYIDAKACLDKGINYREGFGWEDYDFTLQAIKAGLNSCQIRWLSAATPTMTPGESVASTGELIWGKRSMALYKEWGDNVAFESKKGELNAKIRWIPLKNTLRKTGKMIETYNPTYMTYIENNDARGLLNYIDSEKDKKDDEKHNITKKEKTKMLEINKLYSDLCKRLLKEGKEVAGTKEINNMLFHLEDINNNIVTLSSRNTSIPYVIGELTWYFAGINRCDFIGKFGSMWNRITDDGVTNNSAYGYLIQKKHGFNQFIKIIKLLQKDPNSRRAVININTPNENVIETKDEPCTISLQFFVRDNKVDLTTVMRSNDIWFGLTFDIIYFTELQKWVADTLGYEYGTYTHFAGSFHTYERDYEKIKACSECKEERDIKLNLKELRKVEVLKTIINYVDTHEKIDKEEFLEMCKNLGVIEKLDI